MELRFARKDLLNTVLRDARGRPVYRIETPKRRGTEDRVTTISRIEPGPNTPPDASANNVTRRRSNARRGEPGTYVATDNASDTDIHLMRMVERPVATIKWEKLQAVFTHANREKPQAAYMHAKGHFARRRVFIAEDGLAYKWVMGMRSCLLKQCTSEGKCGRGKDAIVVRYHRPVKFFRRGRHPWLEIITPSANRVLDEVVMTFLWVELRRQHKEEGLRNGVHLETGERFT